MSGGMEDSHDQDRQQRIDAEMCNSDETSIESHPKAQDMAIDFQKMAEEAKATEEYEEEVPATQASPTAATVPSINKTTTANASADPPTAAIAAIPPTEIATANPSQATTIPPSLPQANSPNSATAVTNPQPPSFDFNALIMHINSAITTTVATSMANYTSSMEKKEKANEVQRAAQTAEISTLLGELREAKKKQVAQFVPPPTDICIDSTTTPTSKATFASASTPTSKATFASATLSGGPIIQQSVASPSIPQLLSTPPRPKPLINPNNPYAKSFSQLQSYWY